MYLNQSFNLFAITSDKILRNPLFFFMKYINYFQDTAQLHVSYQLTKALYCTSVYEVNSR